METLFSGAAAFDTTLASEQILSASVEDLALSLYSIQPGLLESDEATAIALSEVIDSFTQAQTWHRQNDLEIYRTMIAGYLSQLPPEVWVAITRTTGAALTLSKKNSTRFATNFINPFLPTKQVTAAAPNGVAVAVVAAAPGAKASFSQAAAPPRPMTRDDETQLQSLLANYSKLKQALDKTTWSPEAKRDLVGNLTENNRGRVLALLNDFMGRSSFEFKATLDLCSTVISRWPARAYTILEMLIYGNNPLTINSNNAREILYFIEETGGFNHLFYRLYKQQGTFFVWTLKQCIASIVRDEQQIQELAVFIKEKYSVGNHIDDLMIPLLYLAFPVEDDHYMSAYDRITHMGQFKDHRDDVPPSQRGKLGIFKTPQRTTRLKNGAKGEMKKDLQLLAESATEETRSKVGSEELQEAFEIYLQSNRSEESQQTLLKTLLAYARNQRLLKTPATFPQKQEPSQLLQNLFPQLPGIVEKMLELMPRHLLLRPDKPTSPAQIEVFLQRLKAIWENEVESDIQRRVTIHNAFLPAALVEDPNIQTTIFAMDGIPAELRQILFDNYVEPEPLAKIKIEHKILADLQRDIHEEGEKYETSPPIRTGIRRVKGIGYGIYGLTFGLTSPDDQPLWVDPHFSFFAITDESDPSFPKVVGFVQAHQGTEGNKNKLFLTQINLFTTFLNQSDAAALYDNILIGFPGMFWLGGFQTVWRQPSAWKPSKRL